MVEARRRPTFHVPGEPLTVTGHPLETVERLDSFTALTGLAYDDLIVTPIVTTPIPVYPQNYPEPGAFGDGRRRWANLRPEAMWHPLMWLPKRLALRYVIDSNPEGSDSDELRNVETDDAWAVRVCMELGAIGLYDIDTGEWLDILSSAGLDIDNDAHLARVEEWLDGADDPILDGIDLTAVLDDPNNVDWAVAETSVWMESLRMMMWAAHSESLLEMARRLHRGCVDGVPATDDPEAFEIGVVPDDSEDPDTELVPLDIERARGSATGIAFFGEEAFSSLHETEGSWWRWLQDEMAAHPSLSLDELAAGPVSVLIDRLTELVDDFVPAIEEAAERLGGVDWFTGRDEAVAHASGNGVA